jgi:hypothetical protein
MMVVMDEAVVIDAARTPLGTGRAWGALAAVHPVDYFGPSVTSRYADGLVHQDISAELIAAKWNCDRVQLYELSSWRHGERHARRATRRLRRNAA